MPRQRSRRQTQAIFANLNTAHPHQQRVVRRLSNEPRLLVYHSLGSGKTKTGLLAVQEAFKKNPQSKVLYLSPAGLTKNIEREQEKHGFKFPKESSLNIISYEKAVRRLPKTEQYDLAIVDEAHKLRDQKTKRYKELEPLLTQSKQLLLMSGSPTYHDPSNIGTLVNLLAKKQELPSNPVDFESSFVQYDKKDPTKQTLKLRNTKKLKSVLGKYVDYYEPSLKERKGYYPSVTEEAIKLPLSQDQEKIYRYLEGKLPRNLRKAVQQNLPMSKKQASSLNTFYAGVRQASNTSAPYVADKTQASSVKIDKALSSVITQMKSDKNFKGLIYSNYLDAGINQYKQQLDNQNIPNAMITGALPAKKRQQLVDDYNKGIIKVLLISSAGGEGLDLKGTKLVQILDPHWNEEKIKQVVGRAIRFKSHVALPPSERKVIVQHYLGTVSPNFTERIFKKQHTSIDEYLYNRSKIKSQVNTKLKDLIRANQ